MYFLKVYLASKLASSKLCEFISFPIADGQMTISLQLIAADGYDGDPGDSYLPA